MAATNLQETSYKQERIQIVGSPQQRDGITPSKDQRFLNFFPELLLSKTKPPLFGEPRTYYLRKRPGTTQNLPSVGAVGRGTIYFNGSVYRAAGNQVYRDTTSIITLPT